MRQLPSVLFYSGFTKEVRYGTFMSGSGCYLSGLLRFDGSGGNGFFFYMAGRRALKWLTFLRFSSIISISMEEFLRPPSPAGAGTPKGTGEKGGGRCES